MSIYSRVESAQVGVDAKASCYIYGTPGPGVRSVHIEGEGLLFLSDTAIREMAQVAGFEVDDSRKVELEALREDYALLIEERDALADELLKYREVLSVAAGFVTEQEENDWTQDPQ